MKAESSAASWLKFFSAAGIPREEAENYAVTFSKNQIQLDMLPEIKKEYLKDMGITLMGHIIAILRHAKTVHADELKKTELSTSQKQTAPSGSKPKASSTSKDNKTVSKPSDEEERKQSSNLKRKSTVVQLKHSEEPKTKVRKKLCDSSDDVYITANSTTKSVEVSARNLNYDVSTEEYKKGVFKRLGMEVLNPESSTPMNGNTESVFARLGDKSFPQVSKEVSTSSNINPVKRLVASKVLNKPPATKSIIRTRLDSKRQRILVSPTYMDGVGVRDQRGVLVSPTYMDGTRDREDNRGILVSPTYMDGAREERDVLSRLNCHSLPYTNSSLEKRNIKARLGKTSSQLLSETRLPGTAKKVSFGSVYQKLIPPAVKNPVVRNGTLSIDFSSQKGSIGLSTGVFSRLGKSFY